MATLTARQANRLTAYENVETVLTEDASAYADDPGLQEIATEVTEHIDVLKPLRANGIRRPKGGASTDKKEAKQFLADVTAEVAGDLYAFGTKTCNRTLQAAADYNSSDLFDLRGTRLVDVATHVLNLATDEAPAMLATAVSEARRDELGGAIEAFSGRKNAPRQQVVANQATRLTTGQQFAALAELIQDRLERALRKYKRLNRPFYTRVTAARMVLDAPGSNPPKA